MGPPIHGNYCGHFLREGLYVGAAADGRNLALATLGIIYSASETSGGVRIPTSTVQRNYGSTQQSLSMRKTRLLRHSGHLQRIK